MILAIKGPILVNSGDHRDISDTATEDRTQMYGDQKHFILIVDIARTANASDCTQW